MEKYFDRHSFDLVTSSSCERQTAIPLLIDRCTYIAQGQRNLEILTETLSELWVHVDHFEQIVAEDFM